MIFSKFKNLKNSAGVVRFIEKFGLTTKAKLKDEVKKHEEEVKRAETKKRETEITAEKEKRRLAEKKIKEIEENIVKIKQIEKEKRKVEVAAAAEKEKVKLLEKMKKGLEKEVQKKTAEIVETSKRRLEFITTTSHELRTPLSVLKVNLDMLLEKPDLKVTREQKKLLKEIDEEADHMTTVLADLVEASNMEKREGYLRKKWFWLAPLIRELYNKKLQTLTAAKHSLLKQWLMSQALTSYQSKARPCFLNMLARVKGRFVRFLKKLSRPHPVLYFLMS